MDHDSAGWLYLPCFAWLAARIESDLRYCTIDPGLQWWRA